MRLVIATALLLVLATPSRAQPNPEATAQAKARYETGVLKYNVGDFASALENFKAAYELHPDPALLFNIGQSHRLLGHTQDAIYAYRAYLRELPDAPNRDEVERLRAGLEQEQAQRKAAASATSAPAAATAPAAEPLVVASAPAAPSRPPIYQRWWLWTIVGVAVVGIAVGVGVGVGTHAANAPNPGGSAGSMMVHF